MAQVQAFVVAAKVQKVVCCQEYGLEEDLMLEKLQGD